MLGERNRTWACREPRSTTVSSTKFKMRDRGRAGGIPRFRGIASKEACPGAKCRTEGGLTSYLAGGLYFLSSSIKSLIIADAFSAISRTSSRVSLECSYQTRIVFSRNSFEYVMFFFLPASCYPSLFEPKLFSE